MSIIVTIIASIYIELREGPLCVFPWAGTNSCFISCSTKVIIIKTFLMLIGVAVLFREISRELADGEFVTKRYYQSLVVGSDPDGFGLWLDQVPMICNSDSVCNLSSNASVFQLILSFLNSNLIDEVVRISTVVAVAVSRLLTIVLLQRLK